MNFVEGNTTYDNINIDLDIQIEQCIAKIHNEMIEQVIKDGYTNIYWKHEDYDIIKIPGGYI